MSTPLASKVIGAVLIYALGLWAMDRALGGAWNGLLVVGIGLVLFGVWHSTTHGPRDRGDALVALAVACVIGQGTVLLMAQAREIQAMGTAIIGWGHLAGVMLLAIAWLPLRAQGLLPGGPVRPAAESTETEMR